ncbi:hypothetical protein LCGC14_2429590 [marine sediment metagenome]|uniref:Uncharacterized protein n=1 Tax=marine sediment metagenome TaxID=412755 RepID=A0A0F9BMD8_9ZZZZ
MTETETDKWWEADCPICGDKATIVMQQHEDTILKCSDCEFRWSPELSEHEVIVLARDHIRKRMQ